MALGPGTRLGVYDVTAQIGEGGMGQVYRATDTKLKRQVAIKILPPSLAADHDRLARFQREAEVLASLNHPHIAAIYGLEESGRLHRARDGTRRRRGSVAAHRARRVALDEALPIAKQIAAALEAAHEKGIITAISSPRTSGARRRHRQGAGLRPSEGAIADRSRRLAVRSQRLTDDYIGGYEAGIILGTAAYMSPEQARGNDVDKRADIWAFGRAVRDVTGRRLFEGETASV